MLRAILIPLLFVCADAFAQGGRIVGAQAGKRGILIAQEAVESNYTALRALGQADGDPQTYGTGGRLKGTFSYSATPANDYGAGDDDDNCLQIQASDGGYWIRQMAAADNSASIDADNPIEMDWCAHVVNGFNIFSLVDSLADAYAPNFYVKVPSSAASASGWTLETSGFWNWACSDAGGNDMEKLHFLESDVPITVQHDAVGADNSGQRARMWVMGRLAGAGGNCTASFTPKEIVVGSPTRKSSRDDYNLTFDGQEPNPIGDDTSSKGDAMIRVQEDGAVAGITNYTFRAHFKDSHHMAVRFITAAPRADTTFIGGTYINAPSYFNGAFVAVFEDTVLYRDDTAKNYGWQGDVSGTNCGSNPDGCTALTDYDGDDTGIKYGSHEGNFAARQLGNSGTALGQIELQYGGSAASLPAQTRNWGSQEEPFTIIRKALGRLGPTSGFDCVPLEDESNVQNIWSKTDPIENTNTPCQNCRFLKIIDSTDLCGEASLDGDPQGTLWEASIEPSSISVDWHSSYVDVTLVNYEDNIGTTTVYNVSGGGTGHTKGHTYRGDGSNPAMIQGEVQLEDTGHTITGSTWNDIVARTLTYGGDVGGTVSCDGHLIENATINGAFTVENNCTNITLTNVDWGGSGRVVMTIASGSDVTVTTGAGNGLSAPAGSTITGTGTLTCGGASQSLPYDFDSDSACED